ncbi:hypothetical protein ACTFIW_000580 [Dictyostelium discoideum]
MFKWHQSNNLVYVTFNIPANVTKQDIHAEITSSSIGLGVKGFGLNCEGTLFSSIKGSKWAIKDDTVQVQMDKQQTGVKWSHLLSEITESNAKAVVLFEYEASSEEELSLTPHQVIDIISKDDSGWWEGSKQQMNGVFPSNFVQEFPTDYQPPEDEGASAEATKEEEISKPISQVSRLGINISLGSMDELKNKLANRKTATYTSADIEEAHNNNNNNEESNNNNSSSGSNINSSGGGFVAVKPSGVANTQQRQPGKVLLNNRQSTILSGVPPAVQSIPSSNTNTTTTNTTPAVQPLIQLKPKQTNTEINTSGNSIPATTSKESQSTKEESSSSGGGGNKITSLFKKPLKKITAISALTGSHSSNESSGGGDKNNSGSKTKAKVVYDFESKEPNELNLKKGDIIVVLAKDSSGWWQGINQSTQATGWFSNTFVEEIKEEKLPPSSSSSSSSENKQPPLKIVKSPPPKSSSSSSSQPQTVEAKLQSLSETPKLETARKAGAAKGRKPPSRVRASYLLSDDEKAEREKLKQSFYSHVVSSQKELSMYDNNEDGGGEHLSDDDQPSTPPSISRSGGSFTPTQQSVDKPIERPSKPPPPKRTAAMNSSLNNINEPPPPSNKPPPPPKSSKPLSTSDGYEPPSPPSSTTPITTSGEDTLQKSPTLQRKVASPPSQQIEQELPSSLVGKPPPLKPTPKPRAIQTNSESTAPAPTPSHEVNFKANLKPAKPSSPPIGNSQEIPTDTSPPNATTPQPTPPPLKRVAKPPVQQQPSNENIENITQFKLKPSPASPTSPSSPTIEPISTTTKPPARPPLKKQAAAAPPSPPNEEATTTSPPTLAAKPKVALRNGPSSAPTSPLSQPQQPPPPSTHKRNLSNPNTTNNEKPAPAPPTTKKPQIIKPLPQFNDICVEVSNICNEIQERSDNSQETTTTFKHSYPSLIDSFFSVAVCSNDGQFWGNDDQLNDHCVPMFQVIYPFLYSMLCEEIGLDEVSKFISDQCRPDNYDNQKPLNDQKKSHNPFTLAGQLITANLFTGKYPNAVTRIYQFLNIIQELVNCSSVSCDMVSYLSQKSETSDEILVGHLLKSSGLIKQPDDVLDFFYQINSIQLNSKQVSVLAATLANDGVCPFSQDLKLAPKNIISKTIDLIRICNSTPITSSIFDNNIDNINNSKIIPILSDSGVLMIIIPGLMGISIISPCNNNNNNNNNDNFNHYPNNNHIEFCKKLCSILDQ